MEEALEKNNNKKAPLEPLSKPNQVSNAALNLIDF